MKRLFSTLLIVLLFACSIQAQSTKDSLLNLIDTKIKNNPATPLRANDIKVIPKKIVNNPNPTLQQTLFSGNKANLPIIFDTTMISDAPFQIRYKTWMQMYPLIKDEGNMPYTFFQTAQRFDWGLKVNEVMSNGWNIGPDADKSKPSLYEVAEQHYVGNDGTNASERYYVFRKAGETGEGTRLNAYYCHNNGSIVRQDIISELDIRHKSNPSLVMLAATPSLFRFAASNGNGIEIQPTETGEVLIYPTKPGEQAYWNFPNTISQRQQIDTLSSKRIQTGDVVSYNGIQTLNPPIGSTGTNKWKLGAATAGGLKVAVNDVTYTLARKLKITTSERDAMTLSGDLEEGDEIFNTTLKVKQILIGSTWKNFVMEDPVIP